MTFLRRGGRLERLKISCPVLNLFTVFLKTRLLGGFLYLQNRFVIIAFLWLWTTERPFLYSFGEEVPNPLFVPLFCGIYFFVDSYKKMERGLYFKLDQILIINKWLNITFAPWTFMKGTILFLKFDM